MLQHNDRVKEVCAPKDVEIPTSAHEMKVDVSHSARGEALPCYAYMILRHVNAENSLASTCEPKGRATQAATIIDTDPVFGQMSTSARKILFDSLDIEAPGLVKAIDLIGS